MKRLLEESVIWQDIFNGAACLPFTCRTAWLVKLSEDSALLCTYSHMVPGTSPSKNLWILMMSSTTCKLPLLPRMDFQLLIKWQRWMEWDGTGMCWGGMMGMFWEKHWSLKWRARGSKDNQRRCGRCKWRRKAEVFVWRTRMPWIKWDGEWELKSVGELLLEWGKSGHPHLQG